MGSKLDWTACKWCGISLQVEICKVFLLFNMWSFLVWVPSPLPSPSQPLEGERGVGVVEGVFVFFVPGVPGRKDKEIQCESIEATKLMQHQVESPSPTASHALGFVPYIFDDVINYILVGLNFWTLHSKWANVQVPYICSGNGLLMRFKRVILWCNDFIRHLEGQQLRWITLQNLSCLMYPWHLGRKKKILVSYGLHYLSSFWLYWIWF